MSKLPIFLLLLAATASASDFRDGMVANLGRLDQFATITSSVTTGDSVAQRFYANQVTPDMVNFGIAGETTWGLRQRLGPMKWRFTAHDAIIIIGTNDCADPKIDPANTVANVKAILYLVKVPTVLAGLHHVTRASWQGRSAADRNACADAVNAQLQPLCESRSSCAWAPSPIDEPSYLFDGVHPNRAGYERLAAGFRDARARLGLAP